MSTIVGTQQSPVDVVTAQTLFTPFPENALDVQYRNLAKVSGEFQDHNFVIAPGQQPRLMFRKKAYRLVKVHFHRACEHVMDGSPPSTFELHLVHQREENPGNKTTPPTLSSEKLVVAAFFSLTKTPTRKKKYEAFKMLGSQLQPTRSRAATPSAGTSCKRIPLRDFVPDDLSQWYYYEGSLTAEPFSEDVSWLLIRNPEVIPAADVQEFIENHADQEQRQTQFLNRRFVLRNFE